jgi:hypothetical protein
MNPFNKLPDGTVKSADDIYRELRVEAKAWETTAERCPKCGAMGNVGT